MLIVLRENQHVCLQNLICLHCFFADQAFIDPTFFGIFVRGPLQSFMVNVCIIIIIIIIIMIIIIIIIIIIVIIVIIITIIKKWFISWSKMVK